MRKYVKQHHSWSDRRQYFFLHRSLRNKLREKELEVERRFFVSERRFEERLEAMASERRRMEEEMGRVMRGEKSSRGKDDREEEEKRDSGSGEVEVKNTPHFFFLTL